MRAHVLTLECKNRCPIHLGPLPREIRNQAEADEFQRSAVSETNFHHAVLLA